MEEEYNIGSLQQTYDNLDLAYIQQRQQIANNTQLSAPTQRLLDNSRRESFSYAMSPPPVEGSFLRQTLSKIIDNRPGFVEYKQDPTQAYERLSDGTMQPLYENIVYGSNNEERLAQQQTTGEVWGRGFTRFGGQVLTSFFGSLASVPVGITEWVNTGNFEASYDNDFTRWLGDLDRKTQLSNNIYYSQEDKDSSLFSQLGTSRFYADKVLGGASFTVGMLLSEATMAALTGGASLTTTIPRAGLKATARGLLTKGNIFGKALSKTDDILASTASKMNLGTELIENASKGALFQKKALDFGNNIRFLATSSAYEAGMEARSYRQEAEQDFYDYYKEIGRQPTPEEESEFRVNLDSGSNKVFGANMGILGVSNMAMFGKWFRVGDNFKIPSVTEGINKRVFGIGTKEVAPGTFEVIKRNAFQKVLTPVYSFAIKPSLTEGFWEEGGQGVASKMMSEYLQASYNDEYSKESLTYTDAFLNAMEEQYGTKEGQTDVLVGTIIGTLFGGVSNIQGTNELKKFQQTKADIQTKLAKSPQDFLQNLYTQEDFLSKVGSLNRLNYLDKKVDESLSNGQTVKSSLEAESMLVSMLQASTTIGKQGSFVEVLKGTIQGMSDQTIRDKFGFETSEEVQTFKQEKIDTLTNITADYKKGRDIAELMLGKGSIPEFQGKESLLVDGLAYAYTMARSSERLALNATQRMKQTFSNLGNNVAGSTIDAVTMLSMTKDEIKTDYETLQRERENVEKQVQETIDRLRTEQAKEPNQRDNNELIKLQQQLDNLTTQKSNLDLSFTGIIDIINNEYFSKLQETSFVSTDVFNNLQQNTEATRKFINSLEFTNPEAYLQLDNAFNTLDTALQYSNEFSTIYQGLLDPKFTTKAVSNIFGSKASKAKTLNDITRETLQKIKNTQKEAISNLQSNISNSPLTEEEYKAFQEDKLDNKTIEKIALKLFVGNTLSPQEQEIYTAKKQEIDEYAIKSIQDTVVNKLKVKEPLTSGEQRYYAQNKLLIDDILLDPLNNIGSSIAPEVIPEVSPEIQQQINGHEASRQKLLKESNDTEEINSEYNTWYKDQVKLGNITTEQALQKLELVGQEESFVYQQLQAESFDGRDVQDTVTKQQLKDIVGSSKVIQTYFQSPPDVDDFTPITESELQEYRELLDIKNRRTKFTKLQKVRYKDLTERVQAPQEIERLQSLGVRTKEEQDLLVNYNEAPPLTLEEQQEYTELVNIDQGKGGLTNTQLETFEILEEKLFQYNVLRGTMFNGMSLLSLIEMLQQLETKIENNETNKTSYTPEEIVQISIAGDKLHDSLTKPSNYRISLNWENVLVRRDKTLGYIGFSHTSIGDLLNRVITINPTAVITINGQTEAENFERFNAVPDTKAEIIIGDKSFSITIPPKKDQKAGSTLRLKTTDGTEVETLQTYLNYTPASISGQEGDYFTLYEPLTDGTRRPVASTLTTADNTNGLEYDPTEARKLKNGDVVELVYDETDSYNQALPQEELYDQGKIYIVRNNKVVGIVKAETNDESYKFRKQIIDQGKVTTTITNVLEGLPNLQLNEQGINNIPIDKILVQAQGYMQDGVSNINIPKGTSTRYIRAASASNKTKKVPFVIIKDKLNGRLIAFPVELNSTVNANALKQLEDVLSNSELSTSELAVEVNRVVIKNNLSTSFMVDNISVQDANKITSIRTELQAKTEDIDLDMFSSNFDKYEVSTVVDFNNQPFSASKIVLDTNISSIVSNPKPKSKKETPNQTIESLPEVIVEASEIKKSKKKDPEAPTPVQKTTVQEVVTAKIQQKKPPKGEPKPSQEKYIIKSTDLQVGGVYKQFYKGKYSNIIRITDITENLVTYELENGQESSAGKNYMLKSDTRLERHDGEFQYNNGVIIVRGVLSSNGQTVRGVQMNDGTVKLEVGRLPNSAFESLEVLNLELNDPDLTREASDSINTCG